MLQRCLFRLFFRTRGISDALANMGRGAVEVEFVFRPPEQRALIVTEVVWFEMVK
jgi:hypothetical protein